MNKPIVIFILEDNPVDAKLINLELDECGLECNVKWLPGKDSFLAALDGSAPDLLLCDYSLPGFSGLAALALARERFPQVPVIIVSGAIGEETAIEALKAGATDYVLKQRIKRIGPVVQRALQEARVVAERERAEQATRDATDRLRENEERLRTTLASIGDAVITTDMDDTVTFLNPVAEQLTGWTSSEAIGQPVVAVFNIINELTGEPTESPVKKVMRSGAISGLANHTALNARGGEIIPIEDSAAPIRNTNGQMIGVVMVFHDVTQKRKAEKELLQAKRQAEENQLILEAVIQQMPAGIIVTDATGTGARNNAEMDRIWRRNMGPGENIRQHEFQAFHPDGRKYELDDWPLSRSIMNGEIIRGEEMNIIRGDGTFGAVEVRSAPIRDEDGKLIAGVVIDIDVTERIASEEEARNQAIQIEIQHRLLEQREQERLQIARDLHDGPVQSLIGTTFALRGMLIDGCDPDMAQQLEALQASIQEQIDELRAYSGELRPPTLAKFGLGKAIRSHLELFMGKHPDLHLQYEEKMDGKFLSHETSLALFRIYQESLANIIKHARATEAGICLSEEDDRVILEIWDNGVGFELPTDWLELARTRHLGLVGIRERAEAIGAKLEILTKVGQGTRIRAEVSHLKNDES